MRDAQKTRMYEAERELRRLIGDARFRDKVALWAFIEKVTRDKWFRRTYGPVRIQLAHVRGSTCRSYATGRIEISKWGQMPTVVLHEIAHVLAQPADQPHGWKFCRCYLNLVRHFLGADAAVRLRAAFKTHKVRYTSPRAGRPLSDEQRAVLVARLVAYRESLERRSA